MHDRKNYNSIVVLTTLSVYLGLVFAGGATPSVLAQAATTRGFDIKNEIVVEDDLDKKPDDDGNYSELKGASDEADRQFIEQYAKTILALVRLSEIDGCEITTKASFGFEDNDELLNQFLPIFRKELAINGFHSSLNKDSFSNGFDLKSRSHNDVSPLAYSYVSSLNSLRFESQNKPPNVVLKSTEITFENNQVFIVTRLPRGSIDALLAEKDAQ